MNVVILLPTLNEEKALGQLIDEIKQSVDYEILVIDGYSKDQTVQIAREKNTKVLFQEGKGKAGAIVTAINLLNCDYLLIMDSDYSYDPRDIWKLVQYAEDADEILGFRPFNKISKLHRLGNRILTFTFNMLHGSNVPDVCSGMYLLKMSTIKQMDLKVHGFSIDQEILAQIIHNDLGIKYVPITYRQRIGTPKASTWRQGFTALFTILRLAMKYNPTIFFAFVGSLLCIPGAFLFLDGLYLYFQPPYNNFHTGIFLSSLLFIVLGTMSFTVGIIGAMIRGLERKIAEVF